MESATHRFARALTELERELDWKRLGKLYCWDGGESFFPPEQVEAIREAGLIIASGLAEQLEKHQGTIRRSLYVGAGVAELVPILIEHLVLEREVNAVNLEGEEIDELNRALAAVEENAGIELLRLDTGGVGGTQGPFDHGWMVSVINDPITFPALHDELYERSGELATGRGELEEDRTSATELVTSLLDRLAPDSLFCTTDEELPFVTRIAGERGWRLEASDGAVLSAVVGDPLRFCRLRRRESGPQAG